MSYIRTKDDVIFLTNAKIEDIDIKEYKQVADTIEELCDEFVVKHKSNKKPYVADGYQKHQILEDRQKVFEYDVEIVYSAIWTNKGLIYVAKMNDKGELELI